MRVRFRIAFFRGNKRLRKSDLSGSKDPLIVGMRYVTEFKYLEATKWLLIAEDCWEKYTLLGLINLTIGQREQGEEFLSQAEGKDRKTDVRIVLEYPEGRIEENICGILKL